VTLAQSQKKHEKLEEIENLVHHNNQTQTLLRSCWNAWGFFCPTLPERFNALAVATSLLPAAPSIVI
jgi:hypothetical protein